MDKVRIAVISANLGGIDDGVKIIHPEQTLAEGYEIEFFHLTDANYPLRHKALHPRLQAKIPKMLGYELYPGFDYYIWLDGNFSLVDQNSVMEFVRSCQGLDACFFAHPYRKTVKDEFEFMLSKLNNDQYLQDRYHNEYIEEQQQMYSKLEGFDNHSLYAFGSFIYNKNLIEKQEFNIFQQWFYHNSRYSVQDQLSFPYLLLKNKDIYNIGLLTGRITKINKYVLYHRGH